MYQEVIEIIEGIQRQRISEISTFSNGNTKIDGPPKRCAGLYFIYTSYSLDELINSGAPPTLNAVPIASLARKREGLNLVLQPEDDDFRLVYNGVGGFKGGDYDLRARILQEIKSSHEKTGSLCIRQTEIDDLSKWKYSYIILPSSNSDIEADVEDEWSYEDHALNIEQSWRLHYGWPILSQI